MKLRTRVCDLEQQNRTLNLLFQQRIRPTSHLLLQVRHLQAGGGASRMSGHASHTPTHTRLTHTSHTPTHTHASHTLQVQVLVLVLLLLPPEEPR